MSAIAAWVPLCGSLQEANFWRGVQASLQRRIRKQLWDEAAAKYRPHLYLNGSPFLPNFDEQSIYYHGGTAVAIEAGLHPRAEVLAIYKRMVANMRAAQADSIGLSIHPVYPDGAYMNPMLKPHRYQNGGDWCWFGGRMVQQLIRADLIAEAYEALTPMVARVMRVGRFHEWWSLSGEPQGASDYRGSAGVLGKAAQMLLHWADQQDASTPYSTPMSNLLKS